MGTIVKDGKTTYMRFYEGGDLLTLRHAAAFGSQRTRVAELDAMLSDNWRRDGFARDIRDDEIMLLRYRRVK